MTQKKLDEAWRLHGKIESLRYILDKLSDKEYLCYFEVSYTRKNGEIGNYHTTDTLSNTFNDKFIPIIEEELKRLEEEFEKL